MPVAPHTTDSTTKGLRVRTDNLQSSVGTVVGATSVVTKGLALPSQYLIQVDVWDNYIGGSNFPRAEATVQRPRGSESAVLARACSTLQPMMAYS